MKKSNEEGFFIVELLVVVVLFAIYGLALTTSSITLSQNRARLIHASLSQQLAYEGLEELAGIDPATLDDADDAATTVIRDGVSFDRTLNVTVQADGSRLVDVTVTCPNSQFGGNAFATQVFPLWGSV